MVADKKTWRNGPSEAGKRCALGAAVTLAQLALTEPYLPPACDGLYIRGLKSSDFHLFIDGKEQKIQSVASASEGLRVRDNLGLNDEYSQTPVGRWSTMDWPVPHYIFASAVDYGLLARNRYDISFVPQGSGSAGCHKIRVKVDRRSTIVAAREEYCANESPSDILNGSAFGNQMEQDLASGQPGLIPLALQTGVLRSEQSGGRVQISFQFPMDLLYRKWSQDWILHATVGLLGMIYRRDGSLASRFSDFACCTPYSSGFVFGNGFMTMDRSNELTKQLGFGPDVASELVAPLEVGTLPARYETQLDLPAGEYDLRIVLSDDKEFGRAEAHLKVENYDETDLALSSVFLCNRYRDAHVAEVETKAANFAPQYVPLVSKGVRFTPAGNTSFETGEPLIAYFEIYAPRPAAGPEAGIQAHLKIINAKSGALVKDFPAVDAATYEQPGSTVIPIARSIPIANLPKGQYRLEVQASDAAGHQTPWQVNSFSIQ